ncbi:hypothetical protein [Rhizobium rhizosphaerae]|nr:hypothetical protein [Xaviernesmea rhizosphaerae]
MAKGQIKGNREARKPKKEKSAASPPPALGAQVKLSGAPAAGGSKKK